MSATILLHATAGCRRQSDQQAPSGPRSTTAPLFTEITEQAGLDFVHHPGFGAGGSRYFMPESMSPGAAIFDMDNDGDYDVYFINGAWLAESDAGNEPIRNQLYRNDGGPTSPRFVNVTASSGLGDSGYGMGVAVGDIDNDGDDDVYVTNYGPDALYRNNADGTFTDVTESAGIRNAAWASSADFFDFDADGHLDIFVVNYLELDLKINARDHGGRPEYPGPLTFRGVADVLFRNNGDGTFTDASRQVGLHDVPRRGLGLGIADFNQDGRPDVYIANDAEPNQLWINNADGMFEDVAMVAGCAVNAFGESEASMGVTLGDVENDGDLDLFMTHLVLEHNTLYRNDSISSAAGGALAFADVTVAAGLSAPSMAFTGFGTTFFDYDHDMDLDLVVVNGRVRRNVSISAATVSDHWKPYAEPNLLFANDGGGRFKDVSAQAGSLCSQAEVSRGLVAADMDADGDVDLLVTNGGGPARLFRNDSPSSHWLTVRAVDPLIGRDAIGAQIVVSIGAVQQRRDINRGFSYLCSGPPVAHFGLGTASRIDRMTVHWPNGDVETFTNFDANRSIRLEKGAGLSERTTP